MFWTKRKTLGDILETFNKTLDDLANLSARNDEKYAENEAKVVALIDENLKLNEESAQARRVSGRLKELMA